MTLSLNGYDVLVRIGTNPSAFSASKGEVSAVAERLIKRELTADGMTLSRFKELYGVLGEDATSLVLQVLTETQLLALVHAVDPSIKPGTVPAVLWAERHLIHLAKGKKKPAAKAKTAKSPAGHKAAALEKTKSKPARTTRALGTRSMSARKPG